MEAKRKELALIAALIVVTVGHAALLVWSWADKLPGR
jgi:hypothetical protein